MLLGVDVGGTFTDAVLVDAGTRRHRQGADDAGRPVARVMARGRRRCSSAPARSAARRRALRARDDRRRPTRCSRTRGARTALVATEGFTDLLELGRQDRPELYRLCARAPGAARRRPSCASARRSGSAPDGVLEPLDDRRAPPRVADAVARRRRRVGRGLPAALLPRPRARARDRRARCASALPRASTSRSRTRSSARFREYERCATTVIDASLSPLLGRYLGRLARAHARGAGCRDPLVMQSCGGLVDAPTAARARGAWTRALRARPAARSAAALRRRGLRRAATSLGFDMGGTSCDVCVVEGGRVRETAGREIAGRPIAAADGRRPHGRRRRRLDRLARRRRRAARRARARRAPSPGPACYGRGGDASRRSPTPTSLLGYLDAGSAAGRRRRARRDGGRSAAVGALAGDARPRRARDCAEGIVRVANQRWCGRCAS